MNVGNVLMWGAVSLGGLLVALRLLNHAGFVTSVAPWPIDTIVLGLILVALVRLELIVTPLKSDLNKHLEDQDKDHDDD